MTVRFTWNQAEADRLIHTQIGPRILHHAGVATRDRARTNLANAGRSGHGILMASIIVSPQIMHLGNLLMVEVGSPLFYAIYQEKGIGPVVPVKAKVLRFQPKGSSTYVFASRTKGFPGAYYLTRAIRSLTVADFG